MNVLHCIMSVTYNFKTMLLFREIHVIQYSILACYVCQIVTGGVQKHSFPSLSCWNQLYLLFSKLQCFSLHMNQDTDVDSGPKIVLQVQ